VKTVLGAMIIVLFAAPCRAGEEMQSLQVKPGDTLRSVSEVYLKDPKRWSELLKYNRLPAADPSAALPGPALKVPAALVKDQYRAARLVYLVKEVLLRRTGAGGWETAGAMMALFRNDTLYTRAGARADIKFHTGERLSLAPNTLAVLHPPAGKEAQVEMVAGELKSARTRVLTRSALITPKSKNAEFSARIGTDFSTVVRVSRGVVDVEAQGKKVEVREGYGVRVGADMAPSAPVKLPKSARPGSAPAAPQGDLSVPDRKLVMTDAVSGFHLQVSRDKDFAVRVLDETYLEVERPDLDKLLPPGDYYVRMALIDLLGYEGKFSAPRSIKIK